MLIPVALQLAVLASATIQPASVPGRGEQDAILTLDRAGMVRLSATSGSGTACAVVDHLRGPFASAGQVGVKDCELDLLLDAGTYKVRLSSPAKGRGTVTLRATAFPEQNAAPLRLEPGRPVEQPLRSGQQASFWVHLDARRAVALRASGRTAGQVQLWRSGAWREDLAALDVAPAPRSTQPIHEWWIEQTLEPGDYLFTVYGTDAKSDPNVKVIDTFPEGTHPPIIYPIAIMASSTNADAPVLLAYLKSAAAQNAFKDQGFKILLSY